MNDIQKLYPLERKDQATAHVQRVSRRATDWKTFPPSQCKLECLPRKKSNIPQQSLFVGKHPIMSAGIKKYHTLRLQYLHLSIPTTKKLGGVESQWAQPQRFFSTKPKRRKMRGGRSRSSMASAFDLQLRCWGEEKHIPRYAAVRVHIYYTFHVCIYIYIVDATIEMELLYEIQGTILVHRTTTVLPRTPPIWFSFDWSRR